MQNRQGNYEKTILIISSLLAIGVAVFLILESQGFEESIILPQASSKNDLNAPGSQQVVEATETMKKKYSWGSPVRNEKAVPLNKSVLLVMKEGALFDLLLPEPKFREPMTNLFLTGDKSKNPPEAQLPGIFSPNVGDLDADNDGFSNLEEFKAKTDPRDGASMPPYTDKLFLRRRISHDYILLLKGGSEGSFQIQRLAPGKTVSVFKKVDEPFGYDTSSKDPTISGNRFKILSSREETIQDPKTGPKQAAILKMLDLSTNKEFELVQGSKTNLAEYEAEFEFRWKKRQVIPGVKEGGTFQLPGLGQTYHILKLEENKAAIAPDKGGKPSGTPIEIKQG